ncbi:MAG TPA: hypothetical protein VJR48_12060 [Ktedonobacterales bacterium]|nr:hypothetical protein [Ktedonobacterales bacterium]
MAEVSASVNSADPDDQGQRRSARGNERGQQSGGSYAPLPPSVPLEDTGERVFSLRERDPAATKPLFAPDQWVQEEDFWDTQAFVAISGRQVVPRPKVQSIAPPKRFKPRSRLRSLVVLGVVLVVIALACAGILEFSRLGMNLVKPIHPAPVATQTVAPTHTPVATATPKKKK